MTSYANKVIARANVRRPKAMLRFELEKQPWVWSVSDFIF